MTLEIVAWLRKDRFKAMEAVEKEGWIEAGWLDTVEDYTIPCYEAAEVEKLLRGKVYIGYECYYNGCDEFKTVAKVFDCEVKALLWKEEVEDTETEYRTIDDMELE